MGWFVFLGFIGLIIWFSSRSNNKQTTQQQQTQWQLQQRNQEWTNFVAAYRQVAKTPAEKRLVEQMLHDISLQGLGAVFAEEGYPSSDIEDAAVQQDITQDGVSMPVMANAIQEPKKTVDVQLDNASLLLYFGAFLFVASVGLFIAFGGASGALRTLATLLVMGVMYGAGLWLFKNRPKLQQAGIAFTGIGIVMAPLVGLAFYNYVFAQDHAPIVWLLTSVFCLTLYTHALVTLKKPLISYLLIFTFLSLFESGVSVANAPIYYFGWGLALVGIALQLVNRFKGYWPELKESTTQSSRAFLPISLLSAVVLVSSRGSGQLGISLLLAAAFYGLEAYSTKNTEQESNAIVSQLTAITGVGALAYALGHSWIAVVFSLLILNIAQVLVMALAKARGALWRNFGSVLLSAGVADVLLAIGKPSSLLIAAIGLTGIAVAVWWRQRRADAYGVGVLAFMAVPYIYGQLLSKPRIEAGPQVIVAMIALLAVLAVYLVSSKRAKSVTNWLVYAELSYVLGAVSVTVASIFASPLLCLGIALGLALTMLVLAEYDKNANWANAAAIVLIMPLLRSWNDLPVLLVATIIALLVSISLALRYRREFLRWLSTGFWLVLPVAFGRGVFGSSWTPAEYAWSYMAVMAGLILSRAIARGVVLVSNKIPLTSYARSTSLSYVVGYIAAAVLAVGLSLNSASSHVYTTVILAILIATTWFLSVTVEKRHDIIVLIPVLAQATLLSLIRPNQYGLRETAFLLFSIALATIGYAYSEMIRQQNSKHPAAYYAQQASLITAFVAPLAVLFFDKSSWTMPFGLLIAGIMTCDYLRSSSQANRELAGAIITAAVLWLLGVAGVHEVQAYIHVIIANLAIYAYWRAVRGEAKESDNYLMAMLVTATIPLGLQALGGSAGGLYGWWLLIEQIVFMLLGMTIHKRFVTLWGLYVAVGAVLFQLRNLGWAALTILALFLIGLAVYQLQKHDDGRK